MHPIQIYDNINKHVVNREKQNDQGKVETQDASWFKSQAMYMWLFSCLLVRTYMYIILWKLRHDLRCAELYFSLHENVVANGETLGDSKSLFAKWMQVLLRWFLSSCRLQWLRAFVTTISLHTLFCIRSRARSCYSVSPGYRNCVFYKRASEEYYVALGFKGLLAAYQSFF